MRSFCTWVSGPTVDSELQVFEKLFHGNFIYSQRFYQKSAERKSPKKYFFLLFRFDAWPGIGTRALRVIIQHTRLRRLKEYSHIEIGVDWVCGVWKEYFMLSGVCQDFRVKWSWMVVAVVFAEPILRIIRIFRFTRK